MARRRGRAGATTAEHLIEALLDCGVDTLLANLGTDHAPIIEALAARRRRGAPVPRVLRIAHENAAAHMALGYTRFSGKVPGLLVHVDVGTANAATGLHNALRGRAPVLVMAGTAPLTWRGELTGTRDTYVHFVQEPYDQRGLVRNYVKWEYQLATGVTVRDVVARAVEMAASDPAAPVYLTLPREVLAAAVPAASLRPAVPPAPLRLAGADPEWVEALARRLLAAQRPVIVTSYAGRDEAAPPAIDRLATRWAVGVVEPFPQTVNSARSGEHFLGFVSEPLVGEADLGLLLDTEVPWMPRDAPAVDPARWVQVDVDPLKVHTPMWGFPVGERVAARVASVCAQLDAACERLATAADRRRVAVRRRWLRSLAAARPKRLRARRGRRGAIDVGHLCRELAARMRPEDILVSEAVMSEGVVVATLDRRLPGTHMGIGGGGLGYGGGAALGAKLARPERRVVHVTGDGSFHFMEPMACFAAAVQYGLPIFTVVLDNGGWSAVKECTLKVYGDGAAAASDEFEARMLEGVDFHLACTAVGGHGEAVAAPAEVPAALERCLAAVDAGRPACLTARVARL